MKVGFGIDLYSSETDSWRFLGINFNLVDDFLPSLSGIYCNGSVHWLPSFHTKTMFYFDVETECLKEMPNLPSYGSGLTGDILYLGESNGHLILIMDIAAPPSPSVSEFYVFEMAIDYSEWLVRYHVNVDSIRDAFPTWPGMLLQFTTGVFSVLSVEDSKVVLCLSGVALTYDLNYSRTRKLCDLEPCPNFSRNYRWYHAFRYFDSLFCV